MRDIQHIQKLALKLSQERDPKKITELIDEIRDAAATYVDAMPNQQDRPSAAGGRVAARTHPMDNQKFWLLILFMLVITLALVASLYDLSPILH